MLRIESCTIFVIDGLTELAEKGQLTGRITHSDARSGGADGSAFARRSGRRGIPESVVRVRQSLRAVDPGLVLGLGTEPNRSITMHVFSNPGRSQNKDRR